MKNLVHVLYQDVRKESKSRFVSFQKNDDDDDESDEYTINNNDRVA